MQKHPDPIRLRESALILALFGLFLFASPLTVWWAADRAHWLVPYALWLLLIVLGAWLHRKYSQHDL
ncbi:hypothetical protein [Sedimenticola selenatireducens]|jgi:hypothetical protein|uniref:Uncharacterized protein n=1 Tax=Sedimenticola selenatireducens TaxID=191960 RepID=A0A558DQ75_9GAMM|nr:hypothetical protein [Sedimenticola selenatireducens]TVO69860.1 hypothetical protein FHP88_17465 [Sedimenticola selenatireducens]TVT63189.1 MAG: hypothetical protein FHK78_12130 [Sedimenticola selenatireducens]